MTNQPHSPLSIAALTDQRRPSTPDATTTARSPPTADNNQHSFQQPSPKISSPMSHRSPSSGSNARAAEGMPVSKYVSLAFPPLESTHPERMSELCTPSPKNHAQYTDHDY